MSIPSVTSPSGASGITPVTASSEPVYGTVPFATTLQQTRESGSAPGPGRGTARHSTRRDRDAGARQAPPRRRRDPDDARGPLAAAVPATAARAARTGPGGSGANAAAQTAAAATRTTAGARAGTAAGPGSGPPPGPATLPEPVTPEQAPGEGAPDPTGAAPDRSFLVNGPAIRDAQDGDDARVAHGAGAAADDDGTGTIADALDHHAATGAPGNAGAGYPLPDALTDAADDRASLRRDDAALALHAPGAAHTTTVPGSPTAPTAPLPPSLSPQAGLNQPQAFAQETAQYVAWLVGQGFDKAEIHLNPRELGPIHVEVTRLPDHIDVNFAVQHPQTVNALQQVLPQLHDMLAQQGLNLGQASVGQQSAGHGHSAPPSFDGSRGTAAAGIDPVQPRAGRWRSVALPGGVDDFA